MAIKAVATNRKAYHNYHIEDSYEADIALTGQDFLGVSHQTLYKLISQGLPSHKIGKKRVFFKEDLIGWVRAH